MAGIIETIAAAAFPREHFLFMVRSACFTPILHATARCWSGVPLPKLQLLQRKRARIEGLFVGLHVADNSLSNLLHRFT